ncbi:uncharacterized protein LOC107003418 [Solanum pennellii]|uniref:Uncharacterized protein LOC107003418 n=1 Tax=Solanum pennellii TaxID=28526 RepID=A0ABM1FI99_SOLPN|nr:uncharacterized protein LOC107003418 [Solanum pennellii]
MRDFASCFSENAIQTTSCSNYYSKTSCFPQNSSTTLSTQNNVTCLYNVILSNKKHLLIIVSWSKTNVSQTLYIQFGDNPSNSFKISAISKKKKGKKSIEFDSDDDDRRKIEVFWDLCDARYNNNNNNMFGVEPIDKYYVVVTFDSQIVLSLGDDIEEKIFKNCCTSIAKFSLVSRQEHLVGNTIYSTRAQFCENGSKHDILISCKGENEGKNIDYQQQQHNYPVLSICIDKKMVIRVKRLQWNFRGNQSIFLDGLFVDVMWDVHDWFFNSTNSGCAVFMFRTRSGLDSRLWLEDRDKLMHKNQDKVEFSFMIYASKTT